MEKTNTPAAKSTREQGLHLHAAFVLRIRGLTNKAEERTKENAHHFADNGIEHFGNIAHISAGEIQGLKEAVRLYGGENSSIRELNKKAATKFLGVVRAKLSARINELTKQAYTQTLKALTSPKDTDQYRAAQRKMLNLVGRVEGCKRALVEFDKSFAAHWSLS